MEQLRDDHLAEGRWTFDQAVADRFDVMLAASIPDLAGLREISEAVAVRIVQQSDRVVDLGTSRGAALAGVREAVTLAGVHATYVGLEVSPPMLEAARERFAGEPDVLVLEHDLREPLPAITNAGLTLAIFTLQFVPLEHRLRVLEDVRRSLRPGGALLIAEKVAGGSLWAHELLVELYHDHKRRHGYTDEQIEAKARALEGVLCPLTTAGVEQLLAGAGFVTEPIWRRLNFAAWLARPIRAETGA